MSEEKYKFNFEFTVDNRPELPDGDPQGTWHITESDLLSDQYIVQRAIEMQFSNDIRKPEYEVRLYQENGMALTSECTSGRFVAYRGGIPA